LHNLFLKITACNCTAFLKPSESGLNTEIAILKFLDRCGIDFEAFRSKIEYLQKIPFSSTRKRMSMIISDNDQKMLVIKGASEIILECCSKFQQDDGNIVSIDQQLK